MRRFCTPLVVALAMFATMPRVALAGGSEFPADGTRGIGRGGATFLRADDPSVMLRNPALLADLWDNQVLLGAHFLVPDACFRPTGAYGDAVRDSDVSDFGDGAIYLQAPAGSTDPEGNPIEGYYNEPYPTACYEGPMPFLPTLALSSKLTDELGVGIGFFAPEVLSLSQYGNSDGTIDTPQGPRPNMTRYFRAHLNVSYASLMGAFGYRPAKWIRFGAGFQWTLVAFNTRNFTMPYADLGPQNDIRSDIFGRDLFVPGFVASVHVVPHDNLDVGIGFKWQDAIQSKAKMDLLSSPFGAGEPLYYNDPNGVQQAVGATVPVVNPNLQGTVNSTPIWAPQLSIGVRYGHRLKPRPTDWKAAKVAGGDAVEDHMSSELFDVELSLIYYFNDVFDQANFSTDNAVVNIKQINPDGTTPSIEANVGNCVKEDAEGNCTRYETPPFKFGGKNLWSLRLGGDYNVLPGKLALRGGVSYETDGADREYLDIHQFQFKRIGVHSGLTWRVTSRTDISFGYAHFFLDEIKLQVNPSAAYPTRLRTAEYGFEAGQGEADFGDGDENAKNGFDGVAGREVPYGGDGKSPYYVNTGKFTYSLDVFSLAFTQHF